MSTPQTISHATGLGVKEYDLTESRDNHLIRLPAASTFVVMQCPDVANLSLGDEDTRALDLQDIKQYSTPEGGPIGQAFLSNPVGSGTLRMLFGHAGDIRTDDNVVVEDIDSISADVNVSDRAAREIGKARIEDSGGVLVDPREQAGYAGDYTTVDLNAATGPQTLYSPTNDAIVTGVHMANPGGTADVKLEITDGANTAVLDDPGAATAIHFTDELRLAGGTDSVQVNLETAEGAALTATAYVATEEL